MWVRSPFVFSFLVLAVPHFAFLHPYLGISPKSAFLCRPVGATLKANVDMLHLIQLGHTFSEPCGKLPALGAGPRHFVWN
jgi:CCR4-NOT transcription complex subunit 7/8